MAALWARKIISGDKTYADVPNKLKTAVKEYLIKSGYGALAID